MIYILTGNVRTGKTSALLEWSKNRNDVDGILCPDNKLGKRYFLEINSQIEFPLEVDSNSIMNPEEVIQVGPFHFLKSAFEKSNDYLVNAFNKKEFKYWIIDELGKLELKNEGLHDSAEEFLRQYKNEDKYHLILVVRTSLLEEILQKYHIKSYKIIEKEDLRDFNL